MTPGAATAEHAKLSYWVSFSGTILRVTGPWNVWLGRDGEIPESCGESGIAGKNLFSFIESDGVRWIYKKMHARAYGTGTPVEFRYRCDSAWLRREMQMKISRDGGVLRYDSTVISETRRPRPLPWPTPGAQTLIAMCSFCKAYRFPIESRVWKDIESLFSEPNLPDVFSVSHGICGFCLERFYSLSGSDSEAGQTSQS
jgi:hypothetical protein